MCGIIGTFGSPRDEATRSAAMHHMRERGPDSSGSWEDKESGCWFGHMRLSIIDTSACGDQPFLNEDESVALVCNGEIYNYRKLAEQLKAKGHTFKSTSDSEIILHGYEEWGINVLDHIEGMFAFYLFDRKKRQLFCARDPIGQKPLYYQQLSDGLAMSSSIKSILTLGGQKLPINWKAIAHLLAYGYIIHPDTIWEGIYKLPPGHYLLADAPDAYSVVQYYKPEPPATKTPGRELESTWDALFPEVCNEIITSTDVPISMYLSSGIDSTAVASTAALVLNHKIPGITVGFSGSEKNEAEEAKRIAKELGLPHEVLEVEPQDTMTILRSAYKSMDEPSARFGVPSNWLLHSHARRHYKVTVSGHGGDEVFGGYKWYGRNTYVTQSALYNKGKALFHREPGNKYRSIVHSHIYNTFGRFSYKQIRDLVARFGIQYSEQEFIEPFARYFRSDLPLVQALKLIDLMTFCPANSLQTVDSTSMAHSLEVRCPFLDRRVIDNFFFTTLDPEKPESYEKQFLRNYMKRIGAPELRKKKIGFSYKFSGDSGTLMPDEIQESYWVRNNHFSATEIQTHLQNEETGWIFKNLILWAKEQELQGFL